MDKTIHIPIKSEDKQLLIEASAKEKLKVCSFVRRVALLEADKILKNSEVNN